MNITDATSEYEEARTFPLYNIEKNEKVLSKWEQSFPYRQHHLKNLDEFIEKWPIITKPVGVDLVIYLLI